MKIPLDEIREVPRTVACVEPAEALNQELARGAGDFAVLDGIAIEVTHRRAGLEVFLEGTVRGEVRGTCARCLDVFRFPLDAALSLVLVPASVMAAPGGAVREEEIGLAAYEGDEIDLTPLVHEQTLLALPTRALCSESCRGLCPRCGANLNAGACACPTPAADARLGVLHTMLRAR
jgi:uncharacterized protein